MVKTLASTNAPDDSAGFIDAIPAEAALIDWRGVIVAVNDRWQRHVRAEVGGPGGGTELGRNYLDGWRQRAEWLGEDAIRVAERLDRLLKGEISQFSQVYAVPSTPAPRWFRLVASRPDGGSGAVVLRFSVDPADIDADIAALNRHPGGARRPPAPPPRTSTDSEADADRLLNTLMPVYQALLWDSLFQPEQGHGDAADRRAEAIGRQLAAAGVDAAFVLRLHIDALRALKAQVGGAKSKWLSIESRIVFISVLGFLTNYYRDALRGGGGETASPPAR